MTKRLLLLRHAKSSWDDASLADHDRPLNPRGRRAASRIGRYLRENDIATDLVLCSSATRTVQTFELLRMRTPPQVLVEDELYGADAAEMLARLRQVQPSARSVLLIGHNPGIHELAVTLGGEHEDLTAFPTAALADLRVPASPWTELGPGVATLQAVVTPRELEREAGPG